MSTTSSSAPAPRQPSSRAGLLAGLRTGGVPSSLNLSNAGHRSVSTPHTASITGSFGLSSRDVEADDIVRGDWIGGGYQRPANGRVSEGPRTPAIGGSFAQQQVSSRSARRTSYGGEAASQLAHQQAQQLAQMEMLRLQTLQAQAQQQAQQQLQQHLLAQAQLQQQIALLQIAQQQQQQPARQQQQQHNTVHETREAAREQIQANLRARQAARQQQHTQRPAHLNLAPCSASTSQGKTALSPTAPAFTPMPAAAPAPPATVPSTPAHDGSWRRVSVSPPRTPPIVVSSAEEDGASSADSGASSPATSTHSTVPVAGAKKSFGSLGVRPPQAGAQQPRSVSASVVPMRQPRGPPTAEVKDLGDRNFGSRARKQAGGRLGGLVGLARARKSDVHVVPPVA